MSPIDLHGGGEPPEMNGRDLLPMAAIVLKKKLKFKGRVAPKIQFLIYYSFICDENTSKCNYWGLNGSKMCFLSLNVPNLHFIHFTRKPLGGASSTKDDVKSVDCTSRLNEIPL